MQTLNMSDLSKYTESELIDWLTTADELYENDDDMVDAISDADYDYVRKYCASYYPANQYFIGVGSNVRGSKVKLAYPMNGLVQKYPAQLQSWLSVVKSVTASEKLDGVSGQLIFNKGQFQISFSRGNGSEAADTTRHVRKIQSVPQSLPTDISFNGQPIGDITLPIRVEFIISKENWPKLRDVYIKRDGSKYKNARAVISSIMNSSEVPDFVYQYIDCVAYTIIDTLVDKPTQITTLRQLGFLTPKFEVYNSNETTDFYTQLTTFWRSVSAYELDGIVLNASDQTSATSAANAGQPSAIKYKIADEENQAIATVKGVIYTISKDGYAKPRVEIYPVNLVGVTITYATGFNAGFIKNKGIGPGAKVSITRSGDVIPFIQDVVYSVDPQLPDADDIGEWEWNETGVDAVLIDRDSNPDALLFRLTDTFTKLKIAHLKKGNVQILIDNGYDSVEKILSMDYIEMYQCLGEIGKKVHESKVDRLTGIYWPEFVGALNMLGRGIGIRKVTALYNHFLGDVDYFKSTESILSAPGFELATATPIVENIDNVLKLIERLSDEGVVQCGGYVAPLAPTGSKFKDIGVVFTGVRDPDAENQIIAEGGSVKSGISSSVKLLVCKDTSSASGKAKKAREMGIEVIDILELKRRLL